MNPAGAHYQARAELHEAAAAAIGRRSVLLAQARVAAFLGAVAAGVAADYTGARAWWWAAAVAFLLFLALVRWHARVRRRERERGELAALNREGIRRAERRWSELPRRDALHAAADHAYAADLDLFGAASLAQLLGPASSAGGEQVLEEWLLAPATPEVIAERQRAVRALAPLVEWRETLALRGRATRAARAQEVESFLAWAESPPALEGPVLTVWPWLIPLLLWLPLLATIWLPLPAFWIVGVAGAFVLSWRVGARVRHVLDRAFGREAMFDHFPALFGTIAETRFEDPTLAGIATRLRVGGEDATARIAQLRRIMNLADARFSSLHFLLQLGFLWDLHVLRALQRWQRECGHHVRDWLRAAGELETLARFGGLAHDEPDWCFADVATTYSSLEAEALGHPLIPGGSRVCNDVQVGPPGSFLLVTGSNMSGKSTLLRALGLNTVLALAGAPCCARALRLPPLAIGSSIRVQDSLSRGVSYFMAELERLKQVVDAAAARQGPFLFLLDEILHGTNTAERRIAARSVIAHLVATGAIGAITTHDLELAAGDELRPLAVPVHFTEHFERGEDGVERMAFDYVLRPGLAPSTNALRLMELVGLRTPPAPA